MPLHELTTLKILASNSQPFFKLSTSFSSMKNVTVQPLNQTKNAKHHQILHNRLPNKNPRVASFGGLPPKWKPGLDNSAHRPTQISPKYRAKMANGPNWHFLPHQKSGDFSSRGVSWEVVLGGFGRFCETEFWKVGNSGSIMVFGGRKIHMLS